MNLVQFQVKRAHWRLWDFEAKLLAPFGTTPARLDMLQCIAAHGAPTQSLLMWQLGLAGATVSKMLKLLDAHGLVQRDVDPVDLRRRIVRLTDEARALLAKVRRVLLRTGVAWKARARCLVDIPLDPQRVMQLVDSTRRVQWALKDRAAFVPEPVEMPNPDVVRSLVGEELTLFKRTIQYCQSRFNHLPFMYILET
ncbi:MAG: MarR family transcriptional regulator [Myxococcales bacterium]|jgi:DNA-binding MarR family transcriptional regulator|nr:MarR family transcriptional regulator [Myxococcales bacterium]